MGEKRLYVYDPELVTITINGILITGFAEDGKIECEKMEDNIIDYAGVDGLVSIAKSADKRGTMTLKLANTSPSLPYIRELARNLEEFNLSLVDMNEVGENIVSDGCIIKKDGDINIGSEVEAVEIEILVPYMY